MLAVLQILGALLVLVAFVALQLDRVRSDAVGYLWLNLLGSGVLAGLAAHDRQWGFLLLEGSWAAVAAGGLLARARR
ncbi:MAG: hypothetical protein JSS99_16140 [Actinobacteria bacterium]|nr:hypothetical protein [Actinomycetota bacterium]